MTKINLGMNSCFAVKRWPNPWEWLKIVGEDLNLRYVEFTLDLIDPVLTSEPTRSELARETAFAAQAYNVEIFDAYTGLAIHCFNLLSHPHPGMRRDGLRWMEEALELVTLLGARGLGGHFDALSYTDVQNPQRRQFFIDHLVDTFRYLARLAAKKGHAFILLEQMYSPREMPYTLEETEYFYKRLNEGNQEERVPILLTLDVGHSCCQNYPHTEKDLDPYEWLRRFAAYSPSIHLQQTDGKVSRHWPFTEEYNKVGIIHPQKVIDAIYESGAEEVTLFFEIFHTLGTHETQVLDDLKYSVDYWRKYLPDA
jgi:sugar phosphate isomerase/epimerase